MTTISRPVDVDERSVNRLEPGVEPMRAETVWDLAENLRSRLNAPSDRQLLRTLYWLIPTMIITGTLVSVGDGPIGAALAALFILIVVTWRLPHFSGYVIIAAAPWVVGFARDQVLPLLRVNEALLAVLLLVLAARWLVYSRRIVLRLRSFDYVMVMFGFLLPLIAQFVRLKPLGFDDVMYAAVFLRLALLYTLIRVTIRTQAQVRTALTLSVLSASALAFVGTADSPEHPELRRAAAPVLPQRRLHHRRRAWSSDDRQPDWVWRLRGDERHDRVLDVPDRGAPSPASGRRGCLLLRGRCW
jgi:hypothetical protein